MSLWKVYIGQGGSRFLQPRIVNIKITEMFGNVNFSVTIKSPTEAERNQVKGRMDTAIIQIVRGTTVLVEGFIEDVESGGGYVRFTGRSFLILTGYSTASSTATNGKTEAIYEDQYGYDIIEDLIIKYCGDKDHEIRYLISLKDITGNDVEYKGEVKLHGKKVYQIIREMCQSYGHDFWSTATWVGSSVTEKTIHVGMRQRGSDTVAHKTLYGGRHLRQIPVLKYRSSKTINCLRILGGGTGKDKVSVFVEDPISIGDIGYIEGEPYHNNMIRSVDTAQSVGEAIIDAKKDPIEELQVDLVTYINDIQYGDWVRIIDTHSHLDTIKRIKKITYGYSINEIDTMSIELGEKFDDYQNIIRDLTKGDVDPEPEMAVAGGSLRITANDPPNTYVRIDKGDWYGTDGILYNFIDSTRTFWGGEPPWNATVVGNYFKALVQIKDDAVSATDITYKTSLTATSHTGYTKDIAKAEIITADPEYMPVGEIILRCSSTGGSVSNVTALDEGGSFIYRDARPILGATAAGYGGEGRWELSIDDTWLASTAYNIGDFIGPTVVNGWSYECTNDGTSGGTEPNPWATVLGATVVDGGITWTCRYVHIIPDTIDGVTNLNIYVKPQGNGIVYLG